MSRILFADDEPLVRMAFRSLLDWRKEGFVLAGEATNGEEALQILYRDRSIDILITDIKMPERDGLSLIKAARAVSPDLHVIVLSAFGDYEYVREAFKLGAGDYLLKKDLDAEHLLPLLRKISPEREEEGDGTDPDSLLRALLYDQEGITRQDLADASISLTDEILVLCDVVLEPREEMSIAPENLISLTLSVIAQVLQGRRHHYALSLSSREYVLFLSLPSPRDDAYVDLKVKNLLQNIRCSVEQYLGISCFAGVSWKREWAVEDVPAVYADAVRLVNQRFFNPSRPIITAAGRDSLSVEVPRFPEKLDQETGRLTMLLKIADTEGLIPGIESFVSEFRRTPFSSPMEAVYAALESFRRFLQEGEAFEADRRFREMTRIFNRLQETRSLDDLIGVIEQELAYLQKTLRDAGPGSKKSQVKKAHQFLLDRYSDPDLNLEQAAEEAGVNKTYLSHLFSQELGKRFSDVLTEIRIAHACELLKDEALPIYLVSEKTGYRSVEHFSRVFKKVTGLSPGKYRDKTKD